VPTLDTANALTLASAIAAAVAASAACAAVGLDLWRDHRSHIPHVSAQAGRPADGTGPTLALSNAGPGVAIAAVYFGVDGGYQFGKGVGSGGHLMPYAEAMERVALPDWAAEHPTIIYSCRDIHGVFASLDCGWPARPVSSLAGGMADGRRTVSNDVPERFHS
jgi:hypothetical protein